MKVYGDYDRAELEQQYVPTTWSNVALRETIDRWGTIGAAYRSRTNVVPDLAYGDSERQCVDLFLPSNASGAPVLVFIHGGYWRSKELGKTSYCFCIEPIVEAGAVVVMVEYDLCSDVSMDTLVQQVRHAIA